jgi:hypothetical protein
MKAKHFKDLSPSGKVWASLLIGLSLLLVAAAERDIQRRSPADVNGSRLTWRFLCLNALGALAYFRWGRRSAEG